MQQFKNVGKATFKPCTCLPDEDNLNSFEEQELSRPQPKRLYSPKYISPTTTATDHYNSPKNVSGQLSSNSRHWKSYLAPELARLSPRQAGNINLEGEADGAPEASGNSFNRLKGYSSAYNLRQFDNSGISSQLQQDRADFLNGPPQPSLRKEEYSRRKQEIMNRIKLLQERASLQDERPQSPIGQQTGQQSSIRYGNGSARQQQLLARITSLQQRVESISSDFDSRLKRELGELQKRLRGQFQQRGGK